MPRLALQGPQGDETYKVDHYLLPKAMHEEWLARRKQQREADAASKEASREAARQAAMSKRDEKKAKRAEARRAVRGWGRRLLLLQMALQLECSVLGC
jgi:hypothetical protein